MSLIGFDEMDDMYGRMDRMMNNMMNNMFGSDVFGFNQMMSPFSMNPFNRYMNANALMPQTMGFGHNLYNNMTPDSSYYCSSSVMSMSTDMNGRPQIYEASSSTRSAPGGLRETHSSVRDSASGLQKMAIGRHIEDRGHVTERSRNNYTGEEEHNEEYINIEETDAPQFNEEWRSRTSAFGRNQHQRHNLAALGHREHTRPPQLALPAPQSSSHASHAPHLMQRNKMSHKKHKDKKNKDKKPYKKA
jgi:myeloid leukemia factor 1